MAVLVVRDEQMTFERWEKRLLLQATFGVALILTAIGGASILILYLDPSPLAIPDHTILRSWTIDFVALGYSPDELLERYRIAAVLSSMSTLIYMLLVLGGVLLSTIYRLDIPDSTEPEQARAPVAPAPAEQIEKNLTGATASDDAFDPRTWLQSGQNAVMDVLRPKQDGD